MNAVEPPVKPFYLDAAPGRRFCIAFEPVGPRYAGSVLYIHPFAEEMNKSRRMAAMQARALARRGHRVLLIDLYGCGDSDGDFADARWGIWLDDLERASAWLRQEALIDDRLILWGLRLGATLAVAHANRASISPCALHLWQPVVSGEAYLTQFLRLRLAGEMISGERSVGGTKQLRAEWGAGRSVEVAGYEIASELAQAIDAIRITDCRGTVTPLHWYEVASDAIATPATQNVVTALRQQGVEVDLHVVVGEPFWATTEIAECPQLLRQTASVLAHGQ